MKKLTLTISCCLLIALILSACGVPQEEYDLLESELIAAAGELEMLEGELLTAAEEIKFLESNYESDFDTAMGEMENAADEIAMLESQITETEDMIGDWSVSLTQAQLKMAIAAELFYPTFSGEDLDNPERIDRITEFVGQLEDETINEKFLAWLDSPTDRDLAIIFLEATLEGMENNLSSIE